MRILNKLRSFLELIKYFNFRTAVEISLFRLGFKKHILLKNKRLFTYPFTSLAIEIDRGPILFWKSLEQGKWEIGLIRFIIDLVKPGETILDVGAWVGPFTFLFSHLVGENGRVYAFEPNPESFSFLKNYSITNEINNVYLYNMAISDLVGFVTLYSPSFIDSQGSTILNPFDLKNSTVKASKFKFKWKCDCTTIDEFCLSRDIRPNGIKIDVEGAEMSVLKGATKIIEKYNPWCFLEFHGPFLSEFERQRIWSFITDRAEKIIYIEGNENYLTHNMEVPFNFKPTKRSNYCIFFK